MDLNYKSADVLLEMATHVPDLVLMDSKIGISHTRILDGITMFIDISGFSALCERYEYICSSGADQLTHTLNNYLGGIISKILQYKGDIFKFAGDACLVIWHSHPKLETKEEYLREFLMQAISSGLSIQEEYSNWKTDLPGYELNVKIGISVGTIIIYFCGDEKFQHYIDDGDAVGTVNKAEHLCTQNEIVLSPEAWKLIETLQHLFVFYFTDENHVIIKEFSPQYMKRHLSTAYIHIPPISMKRERKNILKYRPSLLEIDSLMESHMRQYIINPVMQKLDDDQPLEYLSEMRYVTTMFINMAIYSESITNTSNILNGVFRIINSISATHQGCLTKAFMFDKGCTFLVIFGLPGYKQEDECSEALHSAHIIMKKLNSLNDVWNVSIGITSGMQLLSRLTFCGVVGNIYRHEYTVIGRCVNKAARLMQNYIGIISCDEETYYHSKLQTECFQQLEIRELKGIKNVGIIYKYSELNEEDKELVQVEYKLPILGRETEIANCLKILEKTYTQSFSNEQCIQGIILEGNPGVGKSRILFAIMKELQIRKNVVVSGTFSINLIGVPYCALQGILKQVLQIDKIRTQSKKEEIIKLKLENSVLINDIYLLNDLLQLNFPFNSRFNTTDYQNRRKAMHSLIIEILKWISKEDYINFVFDDVQYMDEHSLEVFEDLLKTSGKYFVLMTVKASRKIPDILERILNHQHIKRIFLEGISSDLMITLACQYLDVVAIPVELARIIQEKGKGIPGWCEQLLSAVMTKGNIIKVVPYDISMQKRDDIVFGNSIYLKKLHSSLVQFNVSSIAMKKMKSSTLQNFNKKELIEKYDPLKRKSVDQNVMVAELSSKNSLVGLHIPNTIKDMVMTFFDKMKSFTQITWKAASVLGECFSRTMLKNIIPKYDKEKFVLALRQLMENNILECGSKSTKFVSTFNRLKISNRRFSLFESLNGNDTINSNAYTHQYATSVICNCINREDSKRNSFFPWEKCKLLKFSNDYMMEIAYELLLQEQRHILHHDAAMFLEQENFACINCGGQGFIYGSENILEETSKMNIEFSWKTLIGQGIREYRRIISCPIIKKFNIVNKNNHNVVNSSYKEKETEHDNVNETIRLRILKSPRKKVDIMTKDDKKIESKFNIVNTSYSLNKFTDTTKNNYKYLYFIKWLEKAKKNCQILPNFFYSIEDWLIDIGDISDIDEYYVKSDKDKETPSDSFEDFVHPKNIDLRGCQCNWIAFLMYTMLIRHWKSSGYYGKAVFYLISASEIAIIQKSYANALSLLSKAEKYIEQLIIKEKPSLNFHYSVDLEITNEDLSRIEALKGVIFFELNYINRSVKHLFHSLKILEKPFPKQKKRVKRQTIIELQRQDTIKEECKLIDKEDFSSLQRIEKLKTEALCCYYLLQIFFIWNQNDEVFLATQKMVNCIEESIIATNYKTDIHELILAYTTMMEICSSLGKLDRLRHYEFVSVLNLQHYTSKILYTKDLITIGQLEGVIMSVRINSGQLTTAIQAGQKAWEIWEQIHDVQMSVKFYPLFTQVLVWTSEFENAKLVLDRLKLNSIYSNEMEGTIYYYSLCLSIHLEAGVPFENIEMCLHFISTISMSESENRTQVQRNLASNASRWFARKKEIALASKWHLYAMDTASEPSSLLISLTYLNCLETHLILLVYSLEANETMNSNKHQRGILSISKKIPYYFAILGSSKKMIKCISLCEKFCKEQNNVLEFHWMKINSKIWQQKIISKDENIWMKNTEDPLFIYQKALREEYDNLLYCFPFLYRMLPE